MGSKITYEERTGTNACKMYYAYNNSGKLYGFYYDGASNDGFYYYKRNLQGDIIGILNSSGTAVVTYGYDTWGKLESTTGMLASTVGADNPFRYRGYYYDTETSLYYLNQRYYNPEWGRFINADTIIGAQGDINGHNLFAYCQNNPVNNIDPSGEFFFTVVGGLIGGIVGGITAAVQGKDIGAGIAGGAVQGAIMGAATDIVVGASSGIGAPMAIGGAIVLYALTGVVGGAFGSATEQVVTSMNKGNTFDESVSSIDMTEVGYSALFGGISNIAGMGVGNLLDDVFVQPVREAIKDAATKYAYGLADDFSYMGIRALVAKMTKIELLSGTVISIASNAASQSMSREDLAAIGLY